jgi:hypothetical protein
MARLSYPNKVIEFVKDIIADSFLKDTCYTVRGPTESRKRKSKNAYLVKPPPRPSASVPELPSPRSTSFSFLGREQERE